MITQKQNHKTMMQERGRLDQRRTSDNLLPVSSNRLIQASLGGGLPVSIGLFPSSKTACRALDARSSLASDCKVFWRSRPREGRSLG